MSFIPTHYTAKAFVFHKEQERRLMQAHEAVMCIERDDGGCLKVLSADGMEAWVFQDDVYTGPRRA